MNVKLKRAVMAALTGTALLGFGSNAMADSSFDLIQALVDKGVLTEEEALPLMKSRANDEENAAKKMPKITTDGKFKIESADGNWSFQPIGRVMWDAITTDEDDSPADDFDGTELRRARLGFEGKVYDWGYKFEADFGTGGASGTSSEVSIKDAYISYGTELAGTSVDVKLGQSHIPFGLNTKISSKYMTFLDRPLFADSVISPARESGGVVEIADPKYKWLLSAGLTNGELSGGSTNDNGSTFAMRGSFVPYMEDKEHLVQVGAGYLKKGGGDDFRFRQRLVSHKDAIRHVDTGTLTDVDGADAYTVDAMGIFGPFHAMAEYNDYSVDRDTGSDVDMDGYAIEAGYFITGESLVWKNGILQVLNQILNQVLGRLQHALRISKLMEILLQLLTKQINLLLVLTTIQLKICV
jgi:phosphate-selective porin OprO and OprP